MLPPEIAPRVSSCAKTRETNSPNTTSELAPTEMASTVMRLRRTFRRMLLEAILMVFISPPSFVDVPRSRGARSIRRHELRTNLAHVKSVVGHAWRRRTSLHTVLELYT